MAAVTATFGCAHQGGYPGAGGAGGFAMPVSAAPLTRGTITQTFSITGTVSPLQSASLSSVASGNVLAVNAQIGQRVAKGDLLVKIDDGPLRAQLASAEANLESAQAKLAQTKASSSGDVASTGAGLEAAQAANQTAQTNLHRDQTLFKEGFVSQAALDQAWSDAMAAQAQLRSAQVASSNAALSPNQQSAAVANIHNAQAEVDVAQSQVSLIESQLAQTDVRAPFDGAVTARNVDPGSLAAPGTVLMAVSQLDPVFVDAGVSGAQLSFVRVGTPVTITVSSTPGRSWRGVVRYLNLSAVPGSLTYTARVQVANPDLTLRGGMVADVAFEQAHKAGVILAPRAAVFQTDTGDAMFVIEGKGCPPTVKQCAQSVPVDVGLQNDQQMEVAGPGLTPGMQAILNHSALLQPGTPVMVMPPGGGPGAGGNKPAQHA